MNRRHREIYDDDLLRDGQRLRGSPSRLSRTSPIQSASALLSSRQRCLPESKHGRRAARFARRPSSDPCDLRPGASLALDNRRRCA
jgi:hypothetical protein